MRYYNNIDHFLYWPPAHLYQRDIAIGQEIKRGQEQPTTARVLRCFHLEKLYNGYGGSLCALIRCTLSNFADHEAGNLLTKRDHIPELFAHIIGRATAKHLLE